MKINKAIILVDNHIREFYGKPSIYIGKDSLKFREKSYQNWAALELRKRLDKYRSHDPIELVEDFRHDMSDLACYAKTSKDNFMFSVAYDVATDILDMLLTEV